jgi:hypothetical protein
VVVRPATVPPAARSRSWPAVATLSREQAVIAALVGVGWLLRIVRYAHDRSLWGDEARLALNLRDRGFTGLVHPLAYVQAAPTGFLLAEKTAVRVFGDSEYALRLMPLLAGMASLALFAPLARNVLSRVGAVIAVALYATVDPLVYYSSEVKQYSFDALAAVLLLWLAAPVLRERSLSLRRACALLAAGVVAVWFSHPAIFVAGAVWCALALARPHASWAPRVVVLAIGAAWVASFAASYTLVLHNARSVSSALGLGSSTGGSGVVGVLRNGWHSFAYPVGFAYTTTALAAALACIGCVALLRRDPWLGAALTLTIAVAAVAAAAGRYPFYDRFLLFAVPVALLLVAAGADALRTLQGPSASVVWVVVLGLLGAYPLAQAAAHAASPPGHEEVKPLLARMNDEWRSGDALYVSRVAQYPLRYYAECADCGALTGDETHGLRRLILGARGGETALHSTLPKLEVGRVDDGTPVLTYVADFRRLRGQKRAWFVFTSTWDDTTTRRVLSCIGHRLDAVVATRAAAYLYDLSAKPDAAGPVCSVVSAAP